jgi:hypothetical protein
MTGMTALEVLLAAQKAGVQLVDEGGRLGLEGHGENINAFMARYGEALKARRKEVLALLRGEVDEDTRRAQARLEFALAYTAKLDQESEGESAPDWLAYAVWCLVGDAMEGFVRWGLGDAWPAIQEACQDRAEAKGLRERALEKWAEAHSKREALRAELRWNDPQWHLWMDQLGHEAETWAWRAFLVELALKNPGASSEVEKGFDPWVDLRPWAVWLARNGRSLGLAWRDAA